MVAMTDPDIRRLILSVGALTFGVQIAGMALGAASQLVAGRVLSPTEYGLFVQGFALLSILGLGGLLGLKTASQRFIPQYMEQRDKAALRGFMFWSTALVLASSLGITAISSLVLSLSDVTGPWRSVVQTILIGVPVFALMALFAAQIRAYGHPVLSMILGRPLREAGVLITAFSLLFFASPTAQGLSNGLIAALALSLVISAVILQKYWPTGRAGAFQREWLRRSLPMMAVNLGNMILRRADILIVGYFAGAAAAGVYGICVFITELVAVPLQSMGILFAPNASRLSTRGDMASLQSYIRRTCRFTGGFAVLVAAPILIFADDILMLIGADYAAGATALRILLIGQVVRAMFGNVNLLTMMTGAEDESARILGMIVLVSIGLSINLVPIHGIEGAAWATALTTVLYVVMLVRLANRHKGLRVGPL